MKRYDIIFMIVILAFVTLLAVISLGYRREAAYFPLLIMIPVMALLLVRLLKELLANKRGKSLPEKETAMTKEHLLERKRRRLAYLSMTAWIVGFVLMIYLLGFVISLPLFVLLYLKLHGERWSIVIGLSLAMFAVVYFGFIVVLNTELYQGLLFSL